jgi:hypothetical protein
MKKAFSIGTIIVLSVLFSTICRAQDYKYHSVFIYNFTKYIQWPSGTYSNQFVIGVLGNSPMQSELEKLMANKTVGSASIVVKKIANISAASECQALFIPQSKLQQFESDGSLKSKSVLIITDQDGMGKKGSHVNFIIQEGKIRFEINQTALLESGLKVSSQLTSLAATVYNDGVATR